MFRSVLRRAPSGAGRTFVRKPAKAKDSTSRAVAPAAPVHPTTPAPKPATPVYYTPMQPQQQAPSFGASMVQYAGLGVSVLAFRVIIFLTRVFPQLPLVISFTGRCHAGHGCCALVVWILVDLVNSLNCTQFCNRANRKVQVLARQLTGR